MFKTNREFLNAILASDVSEDIRTYAINALDKMNADNARDVAKRNAKRDAENAPLIASVREFLSVQSRPVTASEVAKGCSLSSTSKATALLKGMGDAVVVTETKVDHRVVKAYALAESEDSAEDEE